MFFWGDLKSLHSKNNTTEIKSDTNNVQNESHEKINDVLQDISQNFENIKNIYNKSITEKSVYFYNIVDNITNYTTFCKYYSLSNRFYEYIKKYWEEIFLINSNGKKILQQYKRRFNDLNELENKLRRSLNEWKNFYTDVSKVSSG